MITALCASVRSNSIRGQGPVPEAASATAGRIFQPHAYRGSNSELIASCRSVKPPSHSIRICVRNAKFTRPCHGREMNASSRAALCIFYASRQRSLGRRHSCETSSPSTIVDHSSALGAHGKPPRLPAPRASTALDGFRLAASACVSLNRFR